MEDLPVSTAFLFFVICISNLVWKGSAVAGQDTTYLPHKGVLSPSENLLYVSYSNGAGPYDGTLGAIKKYNIGTKVCESPSTNIC